MTNLFTNLLNLSDSSRAHRVHTLALTVGSPSAHRRGNMLRLCSVVAILLTIGVGNAWGTETTLAAWSFTSSSYPSNNSNFSATSGTMSTNSTFCMNGSGSTWNDTKGYAFTSVSTVVVTLKLNQKLAAGAQITLAADVYYNKAKNAPVTSYAITTKVGSAAASNTGVGTTSWSLSTSSTNKTSTYTTQAEIASGTTIQFILTASGSAGSGQAYFNNVTIKSTTYTVTYNANSGSGSVPTDATAYCYKAIVTVKGNTGPVSRSGYEFGGWNTNTSGTGTNYTAGSGTFTITANTTLYAKWTAAASCSANPSIGDASLNGSFLLPLFFSFLVIYIMSKIVRCFYVCIALWVEILSNITSKCVTAAMNTLGYLALRQPVLQRLAHVRLMAINGT